MPPSPSLRQPRSPSLRVSPSGKMRSCKRGRSFDGVLFVKEKDADLTLFNDLHEREKDNFLIPGTKDDLDGTISMKLRYFSDFKLGLTISPRVDRSDLLNADSEKNDYDWLLTPPDTPLFPSLDDEIPLPNLARRGRIRTQHISISRSATMDKNYTTRPTRGSASPHRLSPSPRSTTTTLHSRGRPSSAPNSNYIRPATQRSSTPPAKPRYQAPRASTPTARRVSTGSSGYPSSHGRGPSPSKRNCGNSASPKLNTWRSNIPGFSLDAPPNLRTVLADRPASYVRRTSPASSNGNDATHRYRRHSSSPKVSRSANSVDSHDLDRFSSHSKGSVVSSCDDEVDSRSILRRKAEDFPVASRHFFTNSNGLKCSKTVQPFSSGSAPKWPFDSAIHHMDHGQNSHRMFRPLLSSVSSMPIGKKSTSFHERLRPLTSSVTTSSNASSEQGVSVAHDTDVSDHEHGGLSGDWEGTSFPDVEEVSFHEKAVPSNKDWSGMELRSSKFTRYGNILHLNDEVRHVEPGSNIFGTCHDTRNPNFGSKTFETYDETDHPDASSNIFVIDAVAGSGISECLTIADGGCEMNVEVSVPEESVARSHSDFVSTCSKCGQRILTLDIFGEAKNICQNCIDADGFLSDHLQSEANHSNATAYMDAEEESEVSFSNPGQNQSYLGTEMENDLLCPNPLYDATRDISPGQQEDFEERQTSCSIDREEEHLVNNIERTTENFATESYHKSLTNYELVDLVQPQDDLNYSSLCSQVQIADAYPHLIVVPSEASPISLSMSRSSSENWQVAHGMSSSASNETSDHSSFSSSRLNPSTGLSYTSSSSSTDSTSIKPVDEHCQRQSLKKYDLESPRTYTNIKAQHIEPISFLGGHLNPTTGLSYMSSSSSTVATSINQAAQFQQKSIRKYDLEIPRTYKSIKEQCTELISPRIPVPLEGKAHYQSIKQEVGETVLPMKGRVCEDIMLIHDEKTGDLQNDKMGDAYSCPVEISVHEHVELSLKIEQLVPSVSCSLDSLSDTVHVEEGDILDAEVHAEIPGAFNNSLAETVESHQNIICAHMSDKDLKMVDVESSSVNTDSLARWSHQFDVVDAAIHECSVSVPELEGNRDEGINVSSYFESAITSSATNHLGQQPDATVDDSGSLCHVPEPQATGHTKTGKGEVVPVGSPKLSSTRSIRLEESPDTVLFCNSIVQSVANRSATIGVEKEESVCLQGSRLKISQKSDTPHTGNSNASFGKGSHNLHIHLTEKPSQSNDDTPLKNFAEIKAPELNTHHVVPKRHDSAKATKVEARCSCSIL